jgi:hypothetical protein
MQGLCHSFKIVFLSNVSINLYWRCLYKLTFANMYQVFCWEGFIFLCLLVLCFLGDRWKKETILRDFVLTFMLNSSRLPPPPPTIYLLNYLSPAKYTCCVQENDHCVPEDTTYSTYTDTQSRLDFFSSFRCYRSVTIGIVCRLQNPSSPILAYLVVRASAQTLG